MCPSIQRRRVGPSLSRKKTPSIAKESAKASDARPLMPLRIPLVSVEMTSGVVVVTLFSALDTPASSTPRSESQSPIFWTAALALPAMSSRCARSPPSTTTTTATTIAMISRSISTAPSGARHVVTLKRADERRGDRRHDPRGDHRPADRVGRPQQPGQGGQEEQHADEQPGGAAEVAQPARRREHGRQLRQLSRPDRRRVGGGRRVRRRVDPLPEPQVHVCPGRAATGWKVLGGSVATGFRV